jgi:hypothetical protein
MKLEVGVSLFMLISKFQDHSAPWPAWAAHLQADSLCSNMKERAQHNLSKRLFTKTLTSSTKQSPPLDADSR